VSLELEEGGKLSNSDECQQWVVQLQMQVEPRPAQIGRRPMDLVGCPAVAADGCPPQAPCWPRGLVRDVLRHGQRRSNS